MRARFGPEIKGDLPTIGSSFCAGCLHSHQATGKYSGRFLKPLSGRHAGVMDRIGHIHASGMNDSEGHAPSTVYIPKAEAMCYLFSEISIWRATGQARSPRALVAEERCLGGVAIQEERRAFRRTREWVALCRARCLKESCCYRGISVADKLVLPGTISLDDTPQKTLA